MSPLVLLDEGDELVDQLLQRIAAARAESEAFAKSAKKTVKKRVKRQARANPLPASPLAGGGNKDSLRFA